MASSFTRFVDQTQRHTTVGRTPLDEGSSSQRPLPDNTQHSQQTDIHAPGGVRTQNLSIRVNADSRLKPRGRPLGPAGQGNVELAISKSTTGLQGEEIPRPVGNPAG